MSKHNPGHGGHIPGNAQNQGQNNQRRVSGEITVSGIVETNLPKKLVEEYAASNTKTDAREDYRVKLEAITLFFAILVAIFAFIQSCASVKSAKSAQASADAANASVEEIRKQTEITQRPWISVEVTPNSDLFWVDTPDGKYPGLSVKFSVKNEGHSIAKAVQLDLKYFASDPRNPIAPDALKNQSDLCNNPHPDPMTWFDLFPSTEPKETVESTSVAASAISKTAMTTDDHAHRLVGIYGVGCATYRSSFDTKLHQTRFAFHLASFPVMKKGGKFELETIGGLPVMEAFDVGKLVPQKKIGIRRELNGFNEAN